MTNELFKNDYIVYDDFGIKELRCMASGKIVGKRIEVPSKKFPGKTLMRFQRYSDYREIPYLLKDGSISFLIFCEQYQDHDLEDAEIDSVNEQLRRAKIADMKYSGKSDEFINTILVNIEDKHVVRRMTEAEVSERFANTVLK